MHGLIVVLVHWCSLHRSLEDLVVGRGMSRHHIDISVNDVLKVFYGVTAWSSCHLWQFKRNAGFRPTKSVKIANKFLLLRGTYSTRNLCYAESRTAGG